MPRLRKRKGRGLRPRPAPGTLPLFGSDDEARIGRVRGKDSFRPFQEVLGVIHPLLAPSFHQFTDRFAHQAGVIQTVNNIGHQIQPALHWRIYFFNRLLPYPTSPTNPLPNSNIVEGSGTEVPGFAESAVKLA